LGGSLDFDEGVGDVGWSGVGFEGAGTAVGVLSAGADVNEIGDGGTAGPTFCSAVGEGSCFSAAGTVSERVGFALSTVVDA
jgi:hypothetical protein